MRDFTICLMGVALLINALVNYNQNTKIEQINNAIDSTNCRIDSVECYLYD